MRESPDLITPDWLRALLERHACTQLEASRLLRVERRSVERWVAGQCGCPWASAELLRRLLEERSGKAALWR